MANSLILLVPEAKIELTRTQGSLDLQSGAFFMVFRINPLIAWSAIRDIL